MKTVAELEAKLSEASDRLINDLHKVDGDLLILGAGGKMGPSLARLAAQAIRAGGMNKKVTAVSRFQDQEVKNDLESAGVETISCNLLDDHEFMQLPAADNIIYMAGNKFGTTGREYYTWAMNTYLPGRVAEKYKDSRIVVFSSGNVYPFSPVALGGVDESVSPEPLGEYAQSTLGRERMFEYFSHTYGTPMLLYRLNYAIDLRYGVLLEIAQKVHEGKSVSLTMGHANVIWQGDANEIALRSLLKCQSPPEILNVTGPETMSVRWAAQQFAKRFGITASFEGSESETALLSNAAKAFREFGYPRVGLLEMIDFIAEWVESRGPTWNKPTHFSERKGRF
ncbi:NAD-dependent epimerase/dehydratase family protein [Paenibacillus sp. P13VS]|uniref:NAD-dependent epimerase/dehydratase family protein n=1 Tax=Paenibacillus sp. P13VS TaxID=2697367 RepID=UPI00187BB55D|nr:NAD(P)-dependent oxidoreductase [Paenibacillus sp. P13VS]MBE7680309.1 NAD-dependent epimerase/dehydratase family protein [Paenibacillus sp. P13VS]